MLLGSGLDTEKIADTIRDMGCAEPNPPTLYCQSSDDEFGWVQLTCGEPDLARPNANQWVITFGTSLSKGDDEVNRLAIDTLHKASFKLQRSPVSSTLTLLESVGPDELAEFVVGLITSNSMSVDITRVEVVLEYR